MDTYSRDQIESILDSILSSGLIDSEDRVTMPSAIYSRADGSIQLNRRGRELLHELTAEFLKDEYLRTSLSREEMESEVVDSLVEAAKATDTGQWVPQNTIDALITRLEQGRTKWFVMLPVIGIKLPPETSLEVAGGRLGTLEEEHVKALRDAAMDIWKTVKFAQGTTKKRGISRLEAIFNDTVQAADVWFQVEVEGRRRAAFNLALEACILALDTLRFFALYVGIDPDRSALAVPIQGKQDKIEYLQFEDKKQITLGGTFGEMRLPYSLDAAHLKKLTDFEQFRTVQRISGKANPSQVETKIMLGIQQFGEASRLDSAGAKLQWYLSTLETILAKEDSEYRDRSKKVSRRVAQLIGREGGKSLISGRMKTLYDKRRRPVHYGHRSRKGIDVVTREDIQDARLYAYLGTLKMLGILSLAETHDAILDMLDSSQT